MKEFLSKELHSLEVMVIYLFIYLRKQTSFLVLLPQDISSLTVQYKPALPAPPSIDLS